MRPQSPLGPIFKAHCHTRMFRNFPDSCWMAAQVIQDTAVKMGLTPEDDFILRVVQLSELLAIRHCVFLMGPTGSGRSECYKVLAKAIQTGSDKPVNTYLEATNRKKVHILPSQAPLRRDP